MMQKERGLLSEKGGPTWRRGKTFPNKYAHKAQAGNSGKGLGSLGTNPFWLRVDKGGRQQHKTSDRFADAKKEKGGLGMCQGKCGAATPQHRCLQKVVYCKERYKGEMSYVGVLLYRKGSTRRKRSGYMLEKKTYRKEGSGRTHRT